MPTARTRNSFFSRMTFGDPASCIKDGEETQEITEIDERLDTSIVPATKVEQTSGPSAGDFEFRPLTEEEKKEFVNSLDTKGKQILAELAGEAAPSFVEPTA